MPTLNTRDNNSAVSARGASPNSPLLKTKVFGAIPGVPYSVNTMPSELSDLLSGSVNAGTQAKAVGPGSGGGGGPLVSDVQANPRQTGAHDDLKKFADSLASKQHESITNALQRNRDATSSALSDVRTEAGSRGAGPGSGVSSVLQTRAAMEGARRGQALNASLTDVALQQEGAARNAVMGGASDIAGADIARQNAATNLYNAVTSRQSADNQAAMDRMRVPFQNQMDLLNLVMRSKSFLT